MAGISDVGDPASVPPHCINFTSSSSSSVSGGSSCSNKGALDDVLFSLDTHPSRDMIATGTITGNISMYINIANLYNCSIVTLPLDWGVLPIYYNNISVKKVPEKYFNWAVFLFSCSFMFVYVVL